MNNSKRHIITLLFVLAMTLIASDALAQALYTPFPSSFRNTKDNELTGSANLDRVFQRFRSGKRVKVMQIGDSHVKGNYLPRAIGNTLKEYFPNTEFTYYGINGAWARRFYENDMVQRVATERPDLLIVSFGTNEAHGATLDTRAHTETLDLLTTRISEACPGVTFLFTTPPGSYISQRTGGTYTTGKGRRRRTHYRTAKAPNHNTERVAQSIVSYCDAHHIAVWDLYSIVGGNASACTNWNSAGLMNSDQIHYLANGYNLQGRLLGEAIHKAFKGTAATGKRTRLAHEATPKEQRPHATRKSEQSSKPHRPKQ